MRIDVTELLEKVGNTLDLRVSARVNYPEDGMILIEPVRARVKLTNTDGSILVQGSAETLVDLECSRCLTHFAKPVRCEIEELFGMGGSEGELEEGDFVFPIEDNTVDLGELVRQNLILDLPMKPLCKENCNLK